MEINRRKIVNSRAVAPRDTRDSKQIYFDQQSGKKDSDIYFKGSWVLHTLRWHLGDAKFFKALRRVTYPKPELEKVTDGSQVRLVDTEDIRAIIEESAGVDLAWFFELYLRQPELPSWCRNEKAAIWFSSGRPPTNWPA